MSDVVAAKLYSNDWMELVFERKLMVSMREGFCKRSFMVGEWIET